MAFKPAIQPPWHSDDQCLQNDPRRFLLATCTMDLTQHDICHVACSILILNQLVDHNVAHCDTLEIFCEHLMVTTRN